MSTRGFPDDMPRPAVSRETIAYTAVEQAITPAADAAFVRIHFDWTRDGQRLRSSYVVIYRYRNARIARQELYWDVSKVSLLDAANKKKYLVVRDSDGHCVCSNGEFVDRTVAPGTKKTLWAKFLAPPAEVAKITIEVPGIPPFEDATIAP